MRHCDSSLSVCPRMLSDVGLGCSKGPPRHPRPRRPSPNKTGRRIHDQENRQAHGAGAVGCGSCHRRRGLAGRDGPCRSRPDRCADRKLYALQTLRSGQPLQPLCSSQSLQSLCGSEEPLQSLCGGQPLRGRESLQAVQPLRSQNQLTHQPEFIARGHPVGPDLPPGGVPPFCVFTSDVRLRLLPCPIVATGDITLL